MNDDVAFHRGALVVCRLIVGLALAALIVLILFWGPFVGVVPRFGDGSLLVLSGIAVFIASLPALALAIPALRVARLASRRLWLTGIISGGFLALYALWVAWQLVALSQATDL